MGAWITNVRYVGPLLLADAEICNEGIIIFLVGLKENLLGQHIFFAASIIEIVRKLM